MKYSTVGLLFKEWTHMLCMMMAAGCYVLLTLMLPFQYSLKVIVYTGKSLWVVSKVFVRVVVGLIVVAPVSGNLSMSLWLQSLLTSLCLPTVKMW